MLCNEGLEYYGESRDCILQKVGFELSLEN